MTRNAEFVRHVLDLMAPLGAVRSRAMFGGFGIYQGETIFAIVADDRLYFKTDAAAARRYAKLGLAPFTYMARGKTVALTYHEAPAEVLESPQAMRSFALEAISAARRAHRGKKARLSK
jgi:DNA transformation protein